MTFAEIKFQEFNELSSRFGILELRNRVSQNQVTFQVTNSKIFIEIPLSTYLLDFIKY